MADYDEARRAVELLGDYLYEKGFKEPRATIEGNTAVGINLRKGCRDRKALLIVTNYLKALAADSKQIKDEATRKDVQEAIQEGWDMFRTAMIDAPPMTPAQKREMQQQRQRRTA